VEPGLAEALGVTEAAGEGEGRRAALLEVDAGLFSARVMGTRNIPMTTVTMNVVAPHSRRSTSPQFTL
jgi:hypothetical protein